MPTYSVLLQMGGCLLRPGMGHPASIGSEVYLAFVLKASERAVHHKRRRGGEAAAENPEQSREVFRTSVVENLQNPLFVDVVADAFTNDEEGVDDPSTGA